MKKLLLLLIIFFNQITFSQNLIPNGDFELGPDSTSAEWLYWVDSTCTYASTTLGPDFWTVVNPSPDRLIEGDIPCNWDNDTAQSGKAYIVVGIIGTNWYETVKATLLTPLEKDSSYHLEYYIAFQSFQGGVTGSPSRITFKFNGGDSVVSPFITNKEWHYYDTVFIASAISTEIEIISSGVPESGSNLFKGLVPRRSAAQK